MNLTAQLLDRLSVESGTHWIRDLDHVLPTAAQLASLACAGQRSSLSHKLILDLLNGVCGTNFGVSDFLGEFVRTLPVDIRDRAVIIPTFAWRDFKTFLW